MSVCCCIFPKGEQNFLAAKRPCGQFADSFADSHEKGVTSFDVTPFMFFTAGHNLPRSMLENVLEKARNTFLAIRELEK